MMYAATIIQKAWSLTKGMKMTTLTIASSVMVREIAELKLIANAQRNGRRTPEDAGATAEWGLGALRYSRSLVRTSYQKACDTYRSRPTTRADASTLRDWCFRG